MKHLPFVLIFFLSACAHETIHEKPLVNPATVDTLHIIPGPPPLGSARSDEDYKTLHRYQRIRSDAECARAKEEEVTKDFLAFFRAPRGPLTDPEVVALRPFFNRLLAEARPIWMRGKDHWARKRPYVVDTTIEPCVKPENTYAYPSGHSAAAELFADVLEGIFPDRKDALRDRGLQIGEDRILGGVHHPSDVHDAQMLADDAYQAFLRDPNFVAGLDQAKATVSH
jgi:acid phosphatase (class A)